ncbi:MAG: flavin reductase family protein [Chloroflexota bacterium]|nr:MAG: flavin reductase family protein [Chloroflexota bacterium]
MTKITQKPTTALYPVPAVMVSCGTGAEANIITLSWVGTLCSKPPLIGLGMRPSRHSYHLIQQEGEFVINLPSMEQAKELDYCGIVSGRDEDKWVSCGFTKSAGTEVVVPLIAECPVNIECRLRETFSLGIHDLFIGEVVAVQVDETILNEHGRIDFDKAKPFAYLDGEYRQVGELLGTFGYSR